MIISKWRYELQLRRAEDRGRRTALEEMGSLAELQDKVNGLEIMVGCLKRRVLKLTRENGGAAAGDAGFFDELELPY